MPMRCPNCRCLLDSAWRCDNGHQFASQSGVVRLLEEGFGYQLQEFLERLEPIRAIENKPLRNPALYPRLPFGINDHEWRLRRYDLSVIRRLIGRQPRLRILDIGAWNGWLSHRLACDGHDVTGIDYFADHQDGLGARIFYPSDWTAIQMDLLDLELFDEAFDIVILNRCLQFMPDPIAYVQHARRLLAPQGRLVVSGIQYFADPQSKAAAVAATRCYYRETYGFELFLRPTKGYIDATDRRGLEASGLRFRLYPQPWLSNLKSWVVAMAPRHYYGVGHGTAT